MKCPRSHVLVSVIQHVLCELCGAPERLVALHADKDPPSAGLLLVKLQRGEVAEGLAAARAAVAFLLAVDELMANETGRHGESHAALVALVRPHSAVNGLVLRQVGGLCETLAAHRAGVRTHSCVALPVLGHATGQGERHPAVGAGERSFAQVLPLVALQGEGFVEGLVAVCAWERLVVAVHVPLVLAQVRGANEVLAARIADVGLLPRVRADMLAVIRRPDVGLNAERAVIGPLAGVQTLVLLQRALVRVRLATYVAHVRLEACVRLQVTLQVAELVESPVAVRALEGAMRRVDPTSFFHRGQKPRDLVIFVVFQGFLSSATSPALLCGLILAADCRMVLVA